MRVAYLDMLRVGEREDWKAAVMVDSKAATKDEPMADWSAAWRVEQLALMWAGYSAAGRDG